MSGKRPQPFRPAYPASTTRLFHRGQIIVAVCLALLAADAARAAPAADPEAALTRLSGLPYRDDGVDDPAGRHTLFADPGTSFPTPGYNCSGFVTTASRALLGRPLPLDAAKRDRKGDSGPGSPKGEDWDFGYDLICNITEGLPRRVLAPGAPPADPALLDAAKTRGFPLHDAAAWTQALAGLRPGEMAFAALSKTIKGRLYYYHVALVVRDPAGRVFFHHATPGTGVHRLEISSSAGMAALKKEFAEKRFGDKWVLLVAVPLPGGGR
ncbi:hypothetical protein [Solidesulfovibrio sp.]|uniref:hypothetical protein n=1 Tax=Solidesulfovibrio sp. TaxID=2910990 RepID=UPI0026347FC4|nr:hypothetical protein [Solidesulfovibrio sp.]